jgi:integrase
MSGMAKPSTANLFRGAIITFIKYRAGSMDMGNPSYMIEVQRLSQMQMAPRRRKIREFEKIALTPQEVMILLSKIKKNFGEPMYSMAMVFAYTGARPGELEGFKIGDVWHSLKTAKIDWKRRTALVTTEKTHNQRLIIWCPQMDRHFRTFHDSLPCLYPGRNFSMHMYRWQSGDKNMVGGIKTTAKTLRRSFETNHRILGVPQLLVDHVLGHTKGSISDVYTDYTAFEPKLRDFMERGHYMVVNGIL